MAQLMRELSQKAEEFTGRMFGQNGNEKELPARGWIEIELQFERETHALCLDLSSTMAWLSTQIYLLSGLPPPRQCLVAVEVATTILD